MVPSEITEQRVRQWVRSDFGIELGPMRRLAAGADTSARVWLATSADGARYAVKHSGGGSAAGLLVPAHLAERGTVGIPAPVHTRTGTVWSDRCGRRLSLVPWVSGAAAERFDDIAELSPRQWEAFGALLARVHATRVTDELTEQLPHEQYRPERWISEAHAVDRSLRSDPADQLASLLHSEWRAQRERVAALIERAEHLGRRLRRDPAPEVLCHADPHLGNVLVEADQPWLIDWDDAILAPAERDLMFVFGGVLFFAPVTEQQRGWFFTGYGPVDINLDRLTYYQCTRALEDLAGPAAQVLDDQLSPEERAEALEIFRGVLSATGLATRALE